jgi:Fe-S-cluster containining protein
MSDLIVPNGDGRWRKKNVAPNPLPSVYATMDQVFAELVEEGARQDINLVCKPGCAACCTYWCGVFDLEAELIADKIQFMDNRHKIIRRLIGWRKAWDDAYPGDGIGEPQHVIEWQSRRIACPLLDLSNNLCTVYDVRPSVCRTFHAVKSPRSTEATCEHPDCQPQREAPEACWTQPWHVANGHQNWVQMLNADLNAIFMPDMMRAMASTRSKIGYGSMVHFILTIGQRKYGWKLGTYIDLPILQEAVVAVEPVEVSKNGTH